MVAGANDAEHDVLVDRSHPGVALVTLNRPHHLNALTSEMLATIYGTFEELGRDETCRVIVITGAGRGFCAGDDLVDYRPPAWVPIDVGPIQSNMYQQKYVAQLVPRMRALPQPVIAAVNGACAGAGLALAVSCDVRFASADAFFSGIFGRRGLVAENGLAWTLPRLIGHGAASDMLLSGRKIDAATALRYGLVNEVLPPEALMGHALAYARDVAANVSPRSARIIKAQLQGSGEQTLSEALAASDAALREALASEDFQEGVAAMREKRQPVFPDEAR